MLHVVFDKIWRQHPTKQQLYGHLPPISQNIQVIREVMSGTARKAGKNAHRPLHMDDLMLADLKRLTSALRRPKMQPKRLAWRIGINSERERGREIGEKEGERYDSVLPARNDDDDDDVTMYILRLILKHG